MTDQPLIQVLSALERIGVPFMLTGSYASNIYGKVRSTFDADLVVLLDAGNMRSLVEALRRDFFMDSATLAEVKEAGNQFNAVHGRSGLKIDFYLLPGDAYSRTAFQRRRAHVLFGMSVAVIAPEDLILAKLRWAKSGGSQRQVEDARGVWELQREAMDVAYLREWAKRLSLSEMLAELERK